MKKAGLKSTVSICIIYLVFSTFLFGCNQLPDGKDYIHFDYNSFTQTLTIKGKGPLEYKDSVYYSITKIEAPKHIVISSGITSVPDYYFEYDKEGNTGKDRNHFDEIESVKISSTVTDIGDSAFGFCENLKEISIPDSVTVIGESAFRGCNSLHSVIVPDSVESIGVSAFAYCSSLEELSLPSDLAIISEDLCNCCESLKSITIPKSTTKISSGAFHRCIKLASVTFNDKVTDIDECAFSHCPELTEISLPDTASNIGDMAFFCCSDIKSVTVPLSVKKIGTYAFGYSDSEDTTIKIKDFSIKGYKNSSAQTYAQKNGFTFTELN